MTQRCVTFVYYFKVRNSSIMTLIVHMLCEWDDLFTHMKTTNADVTAPNNSGEVSYKQAPKLSYKL